MADRGRGGYQQPRRPAPVSNPGSGRRTDGGAGSKSQPLRVASGGRYGERKALLDQQRGAPLAAPGSPVASGGGGAVPANGAGGNVAASAGGPPVITGGAFGPTQRPNEPNDTPPTAVNAINPAAASPQAALRVLYARYPHPAIRRLIDWSQ